VPGPVLFGLSFGVFAETAGLGITATIVMSATTFAGSAQFAAASVLETGGTVLAAVVSALLLNARYVGMSVAVASIFPGGRARRFLESQLVVDESWALSGRSGRFEWPILVGAGLLLYVLWVASTAIGTVVGDALADPNDLGLDAAFAALFVALALPYLRGRKALQTAALAAGITLALLPLAPAGVPLVAAAVACLFGLRR
jgi:4-azaleucine resistance transporter AzlC